MTTLREAAQQALEALEYHVEQTRPIDKTGEAITALRAALEQPEQKAECDGGTCGLGGYCDECPKRQPEQEPVAWRYTNIAGVSVMHWHKSARLDADMKAAKGHPLAHKVTPLYTHPPRREWRGLTEEEVKGLAGEDDIFGAIIEFARAVEQALKEKNA